MPEHTISRTALYERVWSKPARDVAKTFGVSDVAVAKASRKHQIPLPGRGYWARVAAGQKLRRPRLPAAAPGSPSIITFKAPSQPRPKPPISELPEIPVPATTRMLHPVAQKAYAILRQGPTDDYGRTHPHPGVLNLKVSPQQLPRAVRIMSGLLTAAEKAGHAVKLGQQPSYYRRSRTGEPEQEVQVLLEGMPVTFKMLETARRSEHVVTRAEQLELDRGRHPYLPRYDFHPSGRLELEITRPWHDELTALWRDRKNRPLERALAEVLVNMESIVDAAHQREKERHLEEETRKEIQRRDMEEQKRIEKLHQLVSDWKTVREIRAFLDAAEGRHDGDFLLWAREYVDHIDPTTQS